MVESKRTKLKDESPQPRRLLQFSHAGMQDKLKEGMLRTKNGDYVPYGDDVPQGHSYNLMLGDTHYTFSDWFNQDRLVEGFVKFSFGTRQEQGVYVPNDTYLSIDEILKSNGKIYETGCFVATAVYGNPEAQQVQALRNIRDEFLMGHPLGRKFVEFYYSGAGQKTADFVRNQLPSSIPVIRKGLDLLVETYSKRIKV